MLRILLLISLSFFLIQCEESETDDLYSAQLCLNNADASTADACLAKIAGNTSTLAYSLRCGAAFVKQNIDDTRIVNALNRLDNNNDPTQDPMTDMMAFLTFKSESEVDAAIVECQASGAEGMVALAYMAKMATIIVVGLGLDPSAGAGVDPNALDGLIDGYTPGDLSGSEKEALGATVTLAYPSYCGDGGQFEGEEVCTNLNNSINAGSNTAIVDALLAQLANDN